MAVKTPEQKTTTHDDSIPEPPDTVESLQKILHSWRVRNRPWPYGLPPAPHDAAMVWINKQEGMGKHEYPCLRTVVEKIRGENVEKRIWDTPFADRLVASLRAYLREDRSSQRFIMVAIDDGIPYRGEDNHHTYPQFEGRTLFQNIVLETERMREIGTDEYRKQTVANAKRVAAGLMTPGT